LILLLMPLRAMLSPFAFFFFDRHMIFVASPLLRQHGYALSSPYAFERRFFTFMMLLLTPLCRC